MHLQKCWVPQCLEGPWSAAHWAHRPAKCKKRDWLTCEGHPTCHFQFSVHANDETPEKTLSITCCWDNFQASFTCTQAFCFLNTIAWYAFFCHLSHNEVNISEDTGSNGASPQILKLLMALSGSAVLKNALPVRSAMSWISNEIFIIGSEVVLLVTFDVARANFFQNDNISTSVNPWLIAA